MCQVWDSEGWVLLENGMWRVFLCVFWGGPIWRDPVSSTLEGRVRVRMLCLRALLFTSS